MFSCAVTATPSHQNHGAKISANQEQNRPAFEGNARVANKKKRKKSLLGSGGKRRGLGRKRRANVRIEKASTSTKKRWSINKKEKK